MIWMTIGLIVLVWILPWAIILYSFPFFDYNPKLWNYFPLTFINKYKRIGGLIFLTLIVGFPWIFYLFECLALGLFSYVRSKI